MLPFKVFYEKRQANPLRKKEWEGIETNLDAYEREKGELSPERQQQLAKQIELGVPQERIDAWRDAKLREQEKESKERWLRPKISKEEYEKIYEKNGVKFFMHKNDPILRTPRLISITRDLQKGVDVFLNDIREILPNRGPRFVIQDLNNQKNRFYDDRRTAGYYHKGLIYLDPDYVNDPKYFVHEYAHYLAKKVNRQSYPLIQSEYRKMLDNYFRSAKKKQREDLELPSDEKLRERLAKRLGLPSEYAFSNPDEFFAEIITHWKKIPNNANSYRFKQAVKQVLSRL